MAYIMGSEEILEIAEAAIFDKCRDFTTGPWICAIVEELVITHTN